MSEKREVTIEGGFFLEKILYYLNKIKYKFSTLWAFFFFFVDQKKISIDLRFSPFQALEIAGKISYVKTNEA